MFGDMPPQKGPHIAATRLGFTRPSKSMNSVCDSVRAIRLPVRISIISRRRGRRDPRGTDIKRIGLGSEQLLNSGPGNQVGFGAIYDTVVREGKPGVFTNRKLILRQSRRPTRQDAAMRTNSAKCFPRHTQEVAT